MANKNRPSLKRNKCWNVPNVLTSLFSSLSACWLEEEDRVSYWQGLYGTWQGELQPVQLCGLKKVTWPNQAESSFGWSVSKSFAPVDVHHYHLQPSDRQVNGYCSTGFLSGVLWSCGLHARWKENIVHISQCLWDSWAIVDRQRRHRCCSVFSLSFFLTKRKNIYFQT